MKLGDTVGDYRILEELGRGGEGRVFKGEHVITRRKEALKVLSGAALIEPDLAQRFMREIRVQASLSHPNIAAVHNAFWDRSELVMVMELIDGAPLSELLAKDHISWRQATRIMSQVLAALGHAHAAGVVHRDISPGNIVVGPGGVVKLTDFGLAWTAADMRVTQSGALLGSVNYMSPEQVRGAEKADALSDIYSSGAVLYEAATGSRPFYSENAFQVMRAHIELEPVPPIEKNPQMPVELSRIILKAMAKDPKNRWATAQEFHQALEQFLETAPISSPAIEKPVIAVAPSSEKTSQKKNMLIPARKAFWLGSSWAAGLVLGIFLVGATSYGGLALLERQTEVIPPPPPPVAVITPPPIAEVQIDQPGQTAPSPPPPVVYYRPRPQSDVSPAKPTVTFYPPEAVKSAPIAAAKVVAPPTHPEITAPEVISTTTQELPAVPVAAVAAPAPPPEPNNRVVKFFRGLNPFKKKPSSPVTSGN